MEIVFIFISFLHLNLLPGCGVSVCLCFRLGVGVLTELGLGGFYPPLR